VIEVCAHLGEGHTRLDVSGHEQRAAGGRVCAAVSAVVHTALLGLQEIARQHPDLVSVHITEEN